MYGGYFAQNILEKHALTSQPATSDQAYCFHRPDSASYNHVRYSENDDSDNENDNNTVPDSGAMRHCFEIYDAD